MNKSLSSGKVLRWFGIVLSLHLASLMISIAVAQITVGILVALALLMALEGYRYKRTALDIPIVLFLMVRILAIALSEYPTMSVVALSRELVFYADYFCIVFYLQNAQRKEKEQLFRWLFFSSAVVCVIAVAQTLLGVIDRANGLSGGGSLSTHLCLVIIAVMVLKNDESIFRSPYWFVITFMILIGGLLFTEKRGDWIATTVAVIIFGFVFNKKFAFVLIAVAVCVLLAVTPLRERLFTLARPADNSSDRIALWTNALSHADRHPVLGFGPQTFDSVFTGRYATGDKGIASWHNDSIQIYLESGAIGFVTFLILLGSATACSIALIRTSHRENASVGWMGIMMLASWIIIGFFGSPTVSITNAMLFRFFLGYIAVNHLRKSTAVNSA